MPELATAVLGISVGKTFKFLGKICHRTLRSHVRLTTAQRWLKVRAACRAF